MEPPGDDFKNVNTNMSGNMVLMFNIFQPHWISINKQFIFTDDNVNRHTHTHTYTC